MTGNEAIAEGAIQAGCRFYAGYPITPQNELIAYMAAHLADSGGVFIQAESELAAINMVFGASACGVRVMTSSSSPGISLMQEGISYIAGAQLPAVIVNVMRGGPGLGNIWPAQSDYFQATRGGGHGDYRSVVLAPSTVQESYECMPLAFSLADQYRMPAIILSDGMLGQMMEPIVANRVSHSAYRNDKRLAICDKQKKWALGNSKGRSPNIVKSFYLREGDLEKVNLVLQKKYKTIEDKEQRYQGQYLDDAKVVLVAYGTMARIVKSITHKLRGQGKKVGLLRPVTLWPFPRQAFERLALSKKGREFLVVEMSAGQMLEDVKLTINGRSSVGFLGRLGGGMPSEEEIIDSILRIA